MRFSDHRPPLFMELGNRDYGYDLTPNEHLQEELELAPHRAALESAQSDGATGRRTGGLSHDGGRPAESTRASAHGALTGPGGASPPPAAGSSSSKEQS